MAQPPTAPTTAMLKMFAPKAEIPPSANMRHCTISTAEMTMTRCAGPKQRRDQHAADEVSGRPAEDRKVDHLRGEDERRRQSQQRDPFGREVQPGLSRGGGERRGGQRTGCYGGLGIEKTIRNMHARILP